ncbi:MAG: hypothetical protein ACPGWR_04950 [Ardenticatenaceae bacterium]
MMAQCLVIGWGALGWHWLGHWVGHGGRGIGGIGWALGVLG